MSKYIIEIPDDVQYVLFNGKADNKYYTAVRPIAELEELNSDYINEHFGELQDTAYQAGLKDAWEAARKIIRMPDGDILDLFPDCYASVCTAVQAILKYDASEAIAKLKAYEDKQKDRIEVGDEVTVASLTDGPLTVVGKAKVLDADGDQAMCYSLLSAKTGTVFEHDVKDHGMDEWETPFKTGRHFDHIDKLLEAMRA